MPNIDDLRVPRDQSTYEIDLAKLAGREIVGVSGYVSMGDGWGPVFKLTKIRLSDGSYLRCGGEHDFPYVENPYRKPLPNLEDEVLLDLFKQENPDYDGD